MPDWFLIAVANAMPAIRAHVARWPDDESPPTHEELRELVDLVYRFVPVSEALLRYAKALGGRPSVN